MPYINTSQIHFNQAPLGGAKELILISGVRGTVLPAGVSSSSLRLVGEASVLMIYVGHCDWDGGNPSFSKVISPDTIFYFADAPYSNHYFNTYVSPGEKYYSSVHKIPADAKIRFWAKSLPTSRYGNYFVGVLVEYS